MQLAFLELEVCTGKGIESQDSRCTICVVCDKHVIWFHIIVVLCYKAYLKKAGTNVKIQTSPTLRCSVDTVTRGHHPLGYLYDATNITTIMKMNKSILRIDHFFHDIDQDYNSESFFLPIRTRITARIQRRRTDTHFFMPQSD